MTRLWRATTIKLAGSVFHKPKVENIHSEVAYTCDMIFAHEDEALFHARLKVAELECPTWYPIEEQPKKGKLT